MKKLILILVLLLARPVLASDREDLYRAFGLKLIEAVVLVIKDEINILRAQASLTPRTNQQIINAIDQKLQVLNNYQWMDNQR